MEFIEKTFGRLWTTKKTKLKGLSSTVKVDEIQKYLEITSAYLLPQKNLDFFGSLWSCGFYGDSLFLPEMIGVSNGYEFNKRCYLYLTLKASAIRALEIKSSIRSSSRIAQRIETLTHMPEVNRWLDANFPFFADFEKTHLAEIKRLPKIKKDSVFDFWLDTISARKFESSDSNTTKNRNTTANKITDDTLNKANKLILLQRRNDEVPDYLHFTTPLLWIPEQTISVQSPEAALKEVQDSSPKDQQQRGRSERPEEAKEKDEEVNPIAHSFEKLEVADDYSGGRKVDFSEDDLEQTMNSLDEVELNQVTTEGETTKSTYQQDGQFFTNKEMDNVTKDSDQKFLYPEWNQKKKVYLENHCKVYVIKENLGLDEQVFKNEVLKKFKKNISIWSKKIEGLFNEPIWFRRQKEGPEIDIDALVRSQTDFKAKTTPSLDIYAIKKVSLKEMTVLILFDQSLSTDSWVANRRVLNVIRESIGVIGIIFDKVISSVMVAGVSSATRHRIDFQIYKDFEDNWSTFYKAAPFIQPRGYTRLGPALRHSTECLKEVVSRKKVLLILTDGKPTDLDPYEGSHGVSDVRKAVIEAEQLGIFVSALTIEKETKAHFSKMFKNFVVLPSPDNLAEELYKVLMKAMKTK